MNISNLNKHDIQAIDLCEFYNIEAENVFLVYSPLAGVFFLSDSNNLAKMNDNIVDIGNTKDQEIKITLEQMTDSSDADFSDSIVDEPSKYTRLSIIPNQKCNLSCSYCYASKGRSKAEISEQKLKTMLDFFIDRKRVSSKNLSIFISGGGEPTLSWERVLFIIEYGRERECSQRMNVDFFLMTNGTLIDNNIIEEFRKYNVNIGVSFEILPEIQNTQRGLYDKVSRNIQLMLNKGIYPSISSVITDKNVDKMGIMVDTIIKEYKGIRHLNFDPAMSNDIFFDVRKLQDFYNRFERNFFKAKEVCLCHNITLDCNLIRKAEKLFPRYCQGKLCLTPNGKISICHSISSPLEAAFPDVIYGEVTDVEVVFDINKYKALICKDNYLLDGCKSCIARWHCAGGCLMYKKNYDKAHFNTVCHFTRRMIGSILLKRLDATYKEKHNFGIEELIKERSVP